METDADRLAAIKSLGGQIATVRGEPFWCVFDENYVEALDMGSTTPMITCRSSDVSRVVLVKGDSVTVADRAWSVKGPIEHDGTGMAIVRLNR